MVTTDHAKERWEERFPDFDIRTEYANSRGIGHGKTFQAATTYLSRGSMNKLVRNGGSHYMLVTKRCGAVFIMDKGEVIITVLKIPC